MTCHIDFGLSTVMDRHVSPLAGVVVIGSQLAHEIFESKATLHENSGLPILTSYHVLRVERSCRANGDGLFSCGNLWLVNNMVRMDERERNLPCRN